MATEHEIEDGARERVFNEIIDLMDEIEARDLQASANISINTKGQPYGAPAAPSVTVNVEEEEEEGPEECEHCGTEVEEGEEICPHCRMPMEKPEHEEEEETDLDKLKRLRK